MQLEGSNWSDELSSLKKSPVCTRTMSPGSYSLFGGVGHLQADNRVMRRIRVNSG